MKVIGHVIKILPDDLEGSKHQKFVIRTKAGKEILVVHNIDIAAKIRPLKKGDRIEVYGVYQWNRHGGMIHWTHVDPHGVHPNGWIKHHDKLYQ